MTQPPNQPPGSAPIDPFASIDTGRTFVMPTPGARPAAPSGSDMGFGSMARGADVAGDLGAPDTGLNSLVALANPLLALVPQIRSTTHLADPAALKESMAAGLREFEAKARAAGIASERVLAARYILCTLLDETAASTPWGGSGQWARHNLLVTFHNEAYGGEKIFQLMAKLAEDIPANRDIDAGYIATHLFRLQELTVLRRIDEVKSRLQRTNPLDNPTDYNKMFGELAALEQHRRTLREKIVGVP